MRVTVAFVASLLYNNPLSLLRSQLPLLRVASFKGGESRPYKPSPPYRRGRWRERKRVTDEVVLNKQRRDERGGEHDPHHRLRRSLPFYKKGEALQKIIAKVDLTSLHPYKNGVSRS